MLRSLEESKFIRFFWFCLMLHVLNCSVDIPDPNGQHVSENLSFNDQESIVEIFVEKILGYGNVIAEYDDVDGRKHDKMQINYSLDLLFFNDFKSYTREEIDYKEDGRSTFFYLKNYSLEYIKNFLHPPEFI